MGVKVTTFNLSNPNPIFIGDNALVSSQFDAVDDAGPDLAVVNFTAGENPEPDLTARFVGNTNVPGDMAIGPGDAGIGLLPRAARLYR